jgi:tetratricopeptide (TPR) repeat protein
VLWDAATTAYQCESYEAVVTYLDSYDQQQPGRPWVHYYRAASLLELRRFADALAAADEEAKRSPDHAFPLAVFRAAARAGLEETQQAIKHIDEVLAIPLASVDYLTEHGMRKLCSLMWKTTAPLLAAHPEVRQRVEDFMLAANLAPNDVFELDRETRDIAADMNFYVCTLHQPLDARWNDFLGRFQSEADWKSYDVAWGVLAASEADATQFALAWQQRAFPLPAVVKSIELRDSGYRDRPGVVWQGYRDSVRVEHAEA